ncbi:hypothetical protein [Gloeocapsopsis dulcis]|nr:hypothetical protein [Gloeocapsopsis dulcis]WNN87805.1 hypothetical protein P0S91_15980 [Gloeocapsopsis dulcis]
MLSPTAVIFGRYTLGNIRIITTVEPLPNPTGETLPEGNFTKPIRSGDGNQLQELPGFLGNDQTGVPISQEGVIDSLGGQVLKVIIGGVVVGAYTTYQAAQNAIDWIFYRNESNNKPKKPGNPQPPQNQNPLPQAPPPSPEPEPVPDAGGVMEGNGGSRLNWNWKSKPTFGHTFERHGQGSKNTRSLRGRAATEGKNQRQWLDNQRAAEFLRNLKPNISQPTIVEIPADLGQVILPNGTIVSATHALVVPKANGGYRTAYPVVKP